MEIITLTPENLKSEHICCAISNEKDCQVASKKAWLKNMLGDGLVFKKLNVRGKCFIEYVPAENAWAPVDAPDYMYINCLWASGQYKGKGYATLLLNECIADSRQKGKKGLVILSSEKKRPFLSDSAFLRHKGFAAADSADPYYVLYSLPFFDSASAPRFKPQVKAQKPDQSGCVLYYSDQCPYTAKYVPVAIKKAADMGVELKAVHIESAEQAQSAPAPFTTYSLFYNGEFVTNEILSEKKLEELFSKHSS